MKILIADDDFDVRLAMQTLLPRWGFEIVHANDGVEAWQALQGPAPPRLAILDWMMPGMDGLEVCRLAREHSATAATYLILLTGKSGKDDLVTGLLNGADEYLVKPIDLGELRARLHAARRIVELQEKLGTRAQALEEAQAHLQQLQGLLPLCASCKQARVDLEYWREVESYLENHAAVGARQTLCPECLAAQTTREAAHQSSPT